MKPREYLPAGTPEHREDVQALARRCAVDLAQVIGSGEGKFPDDRRYRLLPVGDRRCQEVLNKFLDTVETQAIALFDRSVAARDLPAEHNVHPLRKRA